MANSPFKVASLIDLDTDSITKRLMGLKDYWESRSDDFGFYTLGKSAYLEGKTHSYQAEKDGYNNLLVKTFPDMYITVVNYLAMTLGEPVSFARDLAIPGFHIFEIDERMSGQAGNWHEDYSHITLGLNGKRPSTVTVAIKLPESGGGLDWVDEEGRPHYLPYHEKDLIWHDGKLLHRIAGATKIKKGDYRITLQGHLIDRGNGMELYW